MRLRLLSIPLLAVVLGACDDASPRPDARAELIAAAVKTRAAGPATAIASVRSGPVRYRLDGRLDPRRGGGYRLCAVIGAAPGDYLPGRSLWLAGRGGAYGTLTASAGRCSRNAGWFDDHPPTLQLYRGAHIRGTIPPGGYVGADDYLHATLVALAGIGPKTVGEVTSRACGRSRCYRLVADFEALDRKPARRDEEGWTLRPLLQSLERHPALARVGPGGYLDRLVLTAPGPLRRGPEPVRVRLGLSGFGEAAPVAYAIRTAIE